MTGFEHFYEAQRLVARARGVFGDHYADDESVPLLLAEAQVHATLALAAAQQLTAITQDEGTLGTMSAAPEEVALYR